MGLVRQMKKNGIPVLIFFMLFFLSANVWSAGYQEEKLFDGEYYTSEDLRKKIEIHSREIQVISNQIKALEEDVDWMILKINQIQDSGRSASLELKESISKKESKIQSLLKTKKRLETLVRYYFSVLGDEQQQGLENIPERKISNLQSKNESVVGSKEKIVSKSLSPLAPKNSIFEFTPVEYGTITEAELQLAVDQSGLRDWVEVIGSGSCLRLETTLPILFPTGSAVVAKEYKSFFEKIADFLKPYDVRVLVNGYADVVPIHNKKYPSNFELGATRAANIVHHLVGHGLKPSIFKIESTGKYRFASKGMSKQKSLERRAEITVIFSG